MKTFRFLFVYDMMIVLLYVKGWSDSVLAVMFMYSFIAAADADVCSKQNRSTAILSHRDMQNMQDSCLHGVSVA